MLKDAREIGHAATLMHALARPSFTLICCGNYAAAEAQANEVIALADQKGATQWKAAGLISQGWLSTLTGRASNAVQMLSSGGMAVDRSNIVDAMVPIMFGERPCE